MLNAAAGILETTSQAMSPSVCQDSPHSATLLAYSLSYDSLDFKFAKDFMKNTAIVSVFDVNLLRCGPYT